MKEFLIERHEPRVFLDVFESRFQALMDSDTFPVIMDCDWNIPTQTFKISMKSAGVNLENEYKLEDMKIG